jgi:hypothetical protein
MKNDDIKRELGIGLGTMAGRLRIYKDPFETSELELSISISDVDDIDFLQPAQSTHALHYWIAADSISIAGLMQMMGSENDQMLV